jgi:hypothetical protein
MGIFRKSAGRSGRHRKGSHSLVEINEESPELRQVEDAAAEDVARIQEDDKYFDREAPANQDELLAGSTNCESGPAPTASKVPGRAPSQARRELRASAVTGNVLPRPIVSSAGGTAWPCPSRSILRR